MKFLFFILIFALGVAHAMDCAAPLTVAAAGYRKLLRAGVDKGTIRAPDLERLLSADKPLNPLDCELASDEWPLRQAFVRMCPKLDVQSWSSLKFEIRGILETLTEQRRMVQVAQESTQPIWGFRTLALPIPPDHYADIVMLADGGLFTRRELISGKREVIDLRTGEVHEFGVALADALFEDSKGRLLYAHLAAQGLEIFDGRSGQSVFRLNTSEMPAVAAALPLAKGKMHPMFYETPSALHLLLPPERGGLPFVADLNLSTRVVEFPKIAEGDWKFALGKDGDVYAYGLYRGAGPNCVTDQPYLYNISARREITRTREVDFRGANTSLPTQSTLTSDGFGRVTLAAYDINSKKLSILDRATSEMKPMVLNASSAQLALFHTADGTLKVASVMRTHGFGPIGFAVYRADAPEAPRDYEVQFDGVFFAVATVAEGLIAVTESMPKGLLAISVFETITEELHRVSLPEPSKFKLRKVLKNPRTGEVLAVFESGDGIDHFVELRYIP